MGLGDENVCLICYDHPPDAVFMECGHGGTCYDCALDVWQNTDECFLCRKSIQYVIHIDLNVKDGKYYKVISST